MNQPPAPRERLADLRERLRKTRQHLNAHINLAAALMESKPWVGLTDEEFKQVCWESGIDGLTGDREVALRAMEALLKEKNNG